MVFLQGFITQVKRVTHDVKSLHINIPNRPSFKPGQFLVLSLEAAGKVRKRAYSIAAPPHWENIEILVKLNPNGRVSPKIFSLKEGDSVELMMPYGLFYLQESFPEKMVFLAGGVGISPILSMLRHLEWVGFKGDLTLIYGNRTPADIIYLDELERFKGSLGLRLVNVIDHPEGTGWSGETGYITEDIISRYADLSSVFYICGPPAMVSHMIQNLEHLSVPHDRIKYEQW